MWGKRVDQPRSKTAEQALSSLMALCARAERSTGDARRLMTRWGVSSTDQEGVITRLVGERFIDDRRYAAAFVRDKSKLNGWGERKIAMELARKGVSRDIIADELSLLEPSQMEQQLEKVLNIKLKSVKYENTRQLRDKLTRFALSRGYSMGAIYKVIDQVIIDHEDNE